MIAEIITVGTEILMGQILNINARYLAQKINELGINLFYQSTVGDNLQRLSETIDYAQKRSDIIIMCGGLGPTEDDLTKWALAKFMQVEMYTHEPTIQKLKNTFSERGWVITPNNYRQAEFPVGSEIIENTCGTAPGCFAKFKDKLFIILPGPPHELEPMFESSVFPMLEKYLDKKLVSRVVNIFNVGESAVAYNIRDLIDAQTNPTIAPYAKPLDVSLRITARIEPTQDPDELLAPIVAEICKRFGDNIYSTHGHSLAQVVARLLAQENKTISVAESLTGGLIASKLIDVPGISKNLLEAIVCYGNDAKIRLGVAAETIAEYSAVSGQVAEQMALCIKKRTGSDMAIATTGVAGPGNDDAGNKEGLIFIAIATDENTNVFQFDLRGNRNRIREAATLHALNETRKALGHIHNI